MLGHCTHLSAALCILINIIDVNELNREVDKSDVYLYVQKRIFIKNIVVSSRLLNFERALALSMEFSPHLFDCLLRNATDQKHFVYG